MLQTGEVFNPSDLYKFDMQEKLKKKQTIVPAKEGVKLLASLGLVPAGSISLDALASQNISLFSSIFRPVGRSFCCALFQLQTTSDTK